MDWTFTIEILIKLSVSLVLGSLIGLEREWSKHPAGLKTHVLVCLGSTTFMLMGYYAVEFLGDSSLSIDPTRMAAGIVTGIGFLGAGAILKEGVNVKGLTTAASIWVTAAIGLCVAAELYPAAFIATFFSLLVLVAFSKLEMRIGLKEDHGALEIKTEPVKDLARRVTRILKKHDAVIENIELEKKESKIILRIHLELPNTTEPARIIDAVSKEDYVVKSEWIE